MAFLCHYKGDSFLNYLFRSVLMMHRIDFHYLFLTFVGLVQFPNVFLPHHYILRAIKKEDREIEQVQMHHKVSLEDILAH